MKLDTDLPLSRCLREITFDYVRAPGPGGQNVNKVASAVQLCFDVKHSHSLEAETKKRLERIAGKRVTRGGVLIIEAHRHRTQEHNRQDAVLRFAVLVTKALETPKSRRATYPSAASKERRLKSKKRRAEVKRQRNVPAPD